VAMDPMTAGLLTLPQIRRMVDEMLRANRRWLPRLASRTLVTAGADAAAKAVAGSLKPKKTAARSKKTR